MRSYLIAAVFVGGLVATPAMAQGDVEVTWTEPKSYTDVKPSNESRSGYRKRVFNTLEEHLQELAEELPDGYKLAMDVTDLDLAGQVWPASFVGFGNSGSDVRIIKQIYIPRMAFTYTLTDETGKTVKSAEVKLKDMGFMDRIRSTTNRDNLVYEKRMLTDWFSNELSVQLSHQKN